MSTRFHAGNIVLFKWTNNLNFQVYTTNRLDVVNISSIIININFGWRLECMSLYGLRPSGSCGGQPRKRGNHSSRGAQLVQKVIQV